MSDKPKTAATQETGTARPVLVENDSITAPASAAALIEQMADEFCRWPLPEQAYGEPPLHRRHRRRSDDPP